ncbi:MAG: glycosyltransferase [Candidatus Sumerlaeota bacterium]|nr:glycosyltransferase [Candidatus Sumerlaeota bacterium]
MSAPRIALVHDWLNGMRGGEKVLEVFCELFPKATLFTLFHEPEKLSPLLRGMDTRVSAWNRYAFLRKRYRHLLPLLPRLIEQFDFTGFDLIISTSHCVAKGAIPRGGAKHLSYVFSPMRYVWDLYETYQERASLPARMGLAFFRGRLQRWDVASSARVTHFIADSQNIANKIKKIYHRDAEVIYPPVDCDFFGVRDSGFGTRCSGFGTRDSELNAPDSGTPIEKMIAASPEPQVPSPEPRIQSPESRTPNPEPQVPTPDYYLVCSAMVPYKRLDIAIASCRRLGRRLIVAGQGPERERLMQLAGEGIEFTEGWIGDEQLRELYCNCRALLFPGEEDFGIIPLEAMACGRPVIALRKGGAMETVVEGKTGLFFDDQTPESLMAAIQRFEGMAFSPAAARARAEEFSRPLCRARLAEAVERILHTK